MFTRRQMAGVVITVVLWKGASGLVKMWAARHSTHEGVDGLAGRTAQIIF